MSNQERFLQYLQYNNLNLAVKAKMQYHKHKVDKK